MLSSYQLIKTNPRSQGLSLTNDGMLFSVVLPKGTESGILLFDQETKETRKLPFPKEFLCGALYCGKLKGPYEKNVLYAYYVDEDIYPDLYCRGIVKITMNEKVISFASLPVPEKMLSTKDLFKAPLSKCEKELIYVGHVRGLTKSKTCNVKHRGTFLGLEEHVPYLSTLGITALTLLPVYAQEKESTRFLNYWGFTKGFYTALNPFYCATKTPQVEFASMVKALHKVNIKLFLLLYFPDEVSIWQQLDAIYYYVDTFGVDGFRLMGNLACLNAVLSDPRLSRVTFLTENATVSMNTSTEEAPAFTVRDLQIDTEYRTLLRQYVKSDDHTLQRFVSAFLKRSTTTEQIRSITDYQGFTLYDLVSYARKHNEANGENNQDGTDENDSWNCGIEGVSRKKSVLNLRAKQMRNFFTLLFLSQGHLMFLAGDECANTQKGNNNPYGQDNEIGYTNYKSGPLENSMASFVRKLREFRMEHPVFTGSEPFHFADYRTIGYPDVSLHGKEAWRPDLSGYSHSIGILFCESYCEEMKEVKEVPLKKERTPKLLMVAINMHWEEQIISLVKLPKEYEFATVLDTNLEEGFLAELVPVGAKESTITISPRSIQILVSRKRPSDKE